MQTPDVTVLDERGKACPIPVIETKNKMAELAVGASVEVIVDNPTAVENLAKFAAQKGYGFVKGPQDPGVYRVTLTKNASEQAAAAATDPTDADFSCDLPARKKNLVVAIAARTMGEGDERLGTTLMKGFIYALTELDELPTTILFYNSGAFLTIAGSESLDDLRSLENAGVQILTCGTCLNHYSVADQLQVGAVTNMYTIVETQMAADLVIKP